MGRLLNIIIIIVGALTTTSAQTVVSGSVVGKTGENLVGSTVLFVKADSVAGGTVTDDKGRFELKGLPEGEYECRVSMLGYKPASQRFALTDKVKLPKFELEDDATVLSEVTVTGDARERTKELAGMSIYYLTGRAKNEQNAYRALQEIPRLVVNEAIKDIKLDDGTTPLILVNGVKKPLDAISPEFIESVEVIDNPSARYRGDSEVASVLNIKLKKEGIIPYLRGEIGAYSTFKGNFFYSSGLLESGTATSSLYLNAVYFQTTNLRRSNFSDIYQGDLHRVQNGGVNIGSKNSNFSFGGDNEFSKKNYIAFNVKYHSNPTKAESNSFGEITDLASRASSVLTSIMNSKTSFHELAGNLYYKHSFQSNRTLELTGNYFYSLNGNKAYREETSEILSYISDIDLDNSRHMGKLDAVYSDMLTPGMQLEAGSNTEYSVTNIDDRLDKWPSFRYRRTREFLFAGIDNNHSQSRFNYVASLGLDLVFSDADGVRNSYVDFVPSLSLSYKAARHHTLMLKYNRMRQMPSAGDLNPHNTSTDLLKENKGNPLLTPSHSDNFRFDYAFSNGKIRLNPYINYIYNSDIVMPYGYMEGDVYISTYQNLGHSSQLKTGAIINYNIPRKYGFYGNISLDTYFNKFYMKGMSFRGSSFNTSLNVFAGYKDVGIASRLSYNGEEYTLYSKKGNACYSTLKFIWQIHESFNVQMQIDTFICARRPIKTWTLNGDYDSYTSSIQKSLAPNIQIGFWYSFHTKNYKQRNKKQFNDIDNELKTVTTE